ncbi:MAG: OadG family protein [Candidatus Gastranaerophilales bacterium]|nr:OadG family protein [Candidatus Gastranaerophilales bacterium]
MYTNLNEGLTAMAVGMGTVFSFLIILMIAVFCMGAIISYLNKIFPEEVNVVKTAVKTACDDTEIAIAIAAAKYRN